MTMPEKLEVKLGESDKIEGLVFFKIRQNIRIRALDTHLKNAKQ